jgi:hypothetical protein
MLALQFRLPDIVDWRPPATQSIDLNISCFTISLASKIKARHVWDRSAATAGIRGFSACSTCKHQMATWFYVPATDQNRRYFFYLTISLCLNQSNTCTGQRPAVTEARERLLLLEAVPAIKRVGRQPWWQLDLLAATRSKLKILFFGTWLYRLLEKDDGEFRREERRVSVVIYHPWVESELVCMERHRCSRRQRREVGCNQGVYRAKHDLVRTLLCPVGLTHRTAVNNLQFYRTD